MQFRLSRTVPLLLVFSLALASGCIFSPKQKPPTVKPPVVYPLQTSPASTLQKLVLAYINRDSLATQAVYDTAYAGTSNDPSAPTPKVEFKYADEIHHVHRLHDDPYIVSVTLDLGPPATWVVLPPNAGDPSDWVIIDTNYQNLEIVDSSIGKTLQSSNRLLEWTFQPKTDGSTTIWKVIRWTENIN